MPEARGRGSARRQGRAAGPQRMRPGPATMARSRSCREPEESIGTRAPSSHCSTLTGMPPLDLLIVSDSHVARFGPTTQSDDTDVYLAWSPTEFEASIALRSVRRCSISGAVNQTSVSFIRGSIPMSNQGDCRFE